MCDQADRKQKLEELGNRIRRGIEETGMHVLSTGDMALIWTPRQDMTLVERRMNLENYASYQNLALHLNEDATIAIFRRSHR